LFEQDQVQAASMHLTIHLQGVTTIAGQQTTPLPAPGQQHAPIMLVTPNDQPTPAVPTPTVPTAVAFPTAVPPTQRLSAVKMPEYAKPRVSEVQREHLKLLEIFEGPNNLSVADYAKLAGKSRRGITYEIQMGNLLSLQLGNRGQRVPTWQLEPLKRQLVQSILRKMPRGLNTWDIYHALQQPHESLDNRSPLDAVTIGNMAMVVNLVVSQCAQQDTPPVAEDYSVQVRESVQRLVQSAMLVDIQESPMVQ
jgi:hypothetical protein